MTTTLTHVGRDGVGVILAMTDDHLPRIVHLGADLDPSGDLAAVLAPAETSDRTDDPPERSILPEASRGWLGTPGLAGSFGGLHGLTHLVTDSVEDDGTGVLVRAHDDRLALTWGLAVAPGGLVAVRAVVENTSDEPYELAGLDLSVPVGDCATELLSFSGRHLRERQPQRSPFLVGTTQFSSRRGRTGLQTTGLVIAGEPGFDFERGQVWGVHLAWSGNHRVWAERTHDGPAALGAGELLGPGEIVLGPGESYTCPELLVSWAEGLDAMAARYHRWLRALPTHPSRPRPVTLNTWEAVYFDQNLDSLAELARLGAQVGVERFVLDDGWFGSRRDDTSGLGDWTVSADVWPEGLGPLCDVVTGLGMEFGLWVEPEMVNFDSDLAREHPEWILGEREHPAMNARHQQVLDLANPQAWEHIRARLDDLLTRYPISYLKWDHNRDTHEPVDPVTGRIKAHEETAAYYRLVDRLKADHPGLEIESCSAGGGRIDLGVLQHTDRVWTSDCIDPLERQTIQTWTSMLVAPEYLGCHVGAPRAHTTERTHDLTMRAATALLGHFGIEWDLTRTSDEDLAGLAAWVEVHRAWREVIATGSLHHRASGSTLSGEGTPARLVTSLVSPERDRALVVLAQLATQHRYPAEPLTVPGLDPDRRYRVRAVDPTPGRAAQPAWVGREVVLTGAALDRIGVATPTMYPETAWVVELTAV